MSERSTNWFSVAMFLAGLVVAGVGGVIRGDFLGASAAEAVERRVNERADREIAEVKTTLVYLRTRLDELIALQEWRK